MLRVYFLGSDGFHTDSLEHINVFPRRLFANPEINLILPGRGDMVVNVSSPVKNWPDVAVGGDSLRNDYKISPVIADELNALEEKVSLGWGDIVRVLSLAAQLELNEAMPFLMRVRLLIQVKFVKGEAILERSYQR